MNEELINLKMKVLTGKYLNKVAYNNLINVTKALKELPLSKSKALLAAGYLEEIAQEEYDKSLKDLAAKCVAYDLALVKDDISINNRLEEEINKVEDKVKQVNDFFDF